MAAIALYELLLARDRLGLRLGLHRRPRIAFDALAVVSAVVATERGQATIAQFPDAPDRGIQERPVVRGDQERAGPAPEVLLQPFERVEVEVVRGFVEQEQVGLR
jgi:hypothetical protein